MPVGKLSPSPPRLGWATGPQPGQGLALGPALAKTQCISQKPLRPGQCWPAQAVGGFGLPVGGLGRLATRPGWATKAGSGWNKNLGFARG